MISNYFQSENLFKLRCYTLGSLCLWQCFFLQFWQLFVVDNFDNFLQFLTFYDNFDRFWKFWNFVTIMTFLIRCWQFLQFVNILTREIIDLWPSCDVLNSSLVVSEHWCQEKCFWWIKMMVMMNETDEYTICACMLV